MHAADKTVQCPVGRASRLYIAPPLPLMVCPCSALALTDVMFPTHSCYLGFIYNTIPACREPAHMQQVTRMLIRAALSPPPSPGTSEHPQQIQGGASAPGSGPQKRWASSTVIDISNAAQVNAFCSAAALKNSSFGPELAHNLSFSGHPA